MKESNENARILKIHSKRDEECLNRFIIRFNTVKERIKNLKIHQQKLLNLKYKKKNEVFLKKAIMEYPEVVGQYQMI